VRSDSGQNKDDCNRKEDDSHRTRSSRCRELLRPSSHSRTVELQIRDPDIKPSCLMILAGILRASSEIGWVKRVYLMEELCYSDSGCRCGETLQAQAGTSDVLTMLMWNAVA
jgi:hypothetical protein